MENVENVTAVPNKPRLLMWYRALKSGLYDQGSGSLKVRYELGADVKFVYCCLGVGAEIAVANGLDVHVEEEYGFTSFGGAEGHWAPAVAEWFGLPGHSNPFITDKVKDPDTPDTPLTAIGANDGLHWTFDQIADGMYEYYGLAEVDEEAGRG